MLDLLLAFGGAIIFVVFALVLRRAARYGIDITQSIHQLIKTGNKDANERWLAQQDREFLAEILQIRASQLPALGAWAASPDFLLLVAQHVLTNKPETIVEFGSGVSTLVILRCLEINSSGKLISFDHDAVYGRITEERARLMGFEPDIRTVPLEPQDGLAGKWYCTYGLPDSIDCIIVDGPPGAIHEETREGAGLLLPRLNMHGVIFLDDAGRRGERAVVQRWAYRHPDVKFEFVSTARGTAIGRKL